VYFLFPPFELHNPPFSPSPIKFP